jgi:hypothetical protein
MVLSSERGYWAEYEEGLPRRSNQLYRLTNTGPVTVGFSRNCHRGAHHNHTEGKIGHSKGCFVIARGASPLG